MIKNTFCHIPGIGLKNEGRLWKQGVLSWDHLSAESEELKKRVTGLKEHVGESFQRLKDEDPGYFLQMLPPAQRWRLFPDFRHSTAYLDIETNGFAGAYGYITTIALYDGSEVYHYVRGKNLDDFKKDIQKYKVIVTFNGTCFDIPFIEDHLHTTITQAHIDLRFILKGFGFAGGLKSCEKKLGIGRGELDGLDGFFAVLLWNDYKRNRNKKALDTLLAYNIQDTINLETLLTMVYNMGIKDTPFRNSHCIPIPTLPGLPFEPDIKTIDAILRKYRNRYSEAFLDGLVKGRQDPPFSANL